MSERKSEIGVRFIHVLGALAVLSATACGGTSKTPGADARAEDAVEVVVEVVAEVLLDLGPDDVCTPECNGKQCGDDGCGGLCGECTGPQEACIEGRCLCQPACEGKECGDDGCGQECGVCDNLEVCSSEGACILPSCNGLCDGPGPDLDDDGQPECFCDQGCFINRNCCPDVCEECSELAACCEPQCDNKECGDDACGGSCGECAVNYGCAEEDGVWLCLPNCEKLCLDRECGTAGLEDECSCGDCDDGNPCTEGICDQEFVCHQLPVDGPCDDGNPCTAPDECVGGECHGELLPLDQLVVEECLCSEDKDCADLEDDDLCNGTLICDLEKEVPVCKVDPDSIPQCGDENPCTDDQCDPAQGCVYPPNDANFCADDDPCNGEETCSEGVCINGEPLVCDDGNPCTDDSCTPGEGCAYAANDLNSCADEDVCNGTETCSGGTCVPGAELMCDDENPCTLNECAPDAGCVYPPDAEGQCSDGDPCNGSEECFEGECVPGVPLTCSDNNPCTDDTCQEGVGCTFVASDANDCSDADACNGVETCSSGNCAPGQPLDCNDENPCTDDFCDPTNGCSATAVDDHAPCEGETGVCLSGLCCIPDCSQSDCGDDGCAGSCGNCSGQDICIAGVCVCQPECDEKECGDDGCGSSCGDCAKNHHCEGGTCVQDPWCGDGECNGDESCWFCPTDCGSCCGNGNCEPDYLESCTTCLIDCGCGCGEQCQDGTCEWVACAGKECGDDGCGGSCGECDDQHYDCVAGQCTYVPWCGDGVCDPSEGCDVCPPDCGLCCGNNICEPEKGETCGSCPADCWCKVCGEVCMDGQCVFIACDGKECGDDGCGGTCGACTGQDACINNQCVCQPACDGKECGDDGCGGTCGTCTGQDTCVNGQCVCQPACDGKKCGDDGCGGQCGTCTGQDACINNQCVCQPACAGKECGDDGCGGACGTCQADFFCSDEQLCLSVVWTDPATGLMWPRTMMADDVDWHAANEYCEDLELAGHSDWRVPSLANLRSLIRGCPATETGGSCTATEGGCTVPTCGGGCNGCAVYSGPNGGCYWPEELLTIDCNNKFWSSLTYKKYAAEGAWWVVFVRGMVAADQYSGGLAVLCVRP